MTSNALKIMPEWIEDEEPCPHATPLRQLIANRLYEIGSHQGYQLVPSIYGTLSTTFSHPVFAMPHLDVAVGIHGFNTAFRPTDNDEGTHLVAFGQYYICTNVPLKDQFEFIRNIFLEVIQSSFPSELGLTDIKLAEGSYEWQADSTGYKGGGGEVNVTSVTLDGTEHKIGRLELAQINDYAVSGGIQGKPCHLIVFGIDRLINLYVIAKSIKEGRGDSVAGMLIQDLYLMDKKEAALHEGLIDVFRSSPANSAAILSSIYTELTEIGQAFGKKEFTPELFARLGQVSSLAECAYAANVVTRNYRQYLIHQLSHLYAQFAAHIAGHPQTHLQMIEQLITRGRQISFSIPSIGDVLSLPFFKRHFSFCSRTEEREIHENLIPQNLIEFFRDEEIGKEADPLPQFMLKRRMFCRAVGEDLAQPVEALAQPTNHVLTLAGSITDRITRIGILLDYSERNGLARNTGINYGMLKNQLRYLAVEWQYRSVKIYPQLEGLIGAIAMEQQGFEASLIERLKAFHLAGTKRQTSLHTPETLLLVLVGKLDEAASLFVRSIENGRSIGSNDPFGVKAKIAVAAEAAKALGLDVDDLRGLMTQIIKINPDAVGDEAKLSSGYFWTRIEKALGVKRKSPEALDLEYCQSHEAAA